MNRDYGCAECDLANDGRHTYECLRDQEEDRRTRNAVRNTRLLTLTEAIERLERKRMRNAVLELRTMMRDDAAAKKPKGTR